jgi:hypothetical protein
MPCRILPFQVFRNIIFMGKIIIASNFLRLTGGVARYDGSTNRESGEFLDRKTDLGRGNLHCHDVLAGSPSRSGPHLPQDVPKGDGRKMIFCSPARRRRSKPGDHPM